MQIEPINSSTMYHLEEIAEILKGKLQKGINEVPVINTLLTDSRKISNPKQSLFFALQTKRNDGHKYIKELHARGIDNFVVSTGSEAYWAEGANYIVVKDTLNALQELAAFHRKQFHIPVIGITGSNGKTIVKDWICQMLAPEKNIICSPKSYNSQIGVPLSVWLMNEHHDIAVFEAGISEPNEMLHLQSIIKPTIGIFTNIGQAHDENFLTANQKIAEKLHLFTHVETLIYSIDIADIHSNILSFEAFRNIKRFTWGRKEEADVCVLDIKRFDNQTTFELLYNKNKFTCTIPFIDSASIENALHVITLLCFMGYDTETIASRIKSLAPIAMRLELKEGFNNCSIINDSYSSDLNSLKIALDFLQQQKQHSKRTLILSDLLQSGKTEPELYAEIADMVKQKGVDFLIGIGEAVSRQADKFDIKKVFYNTTENFLTDFPISEFKNETILLKGARPFRFERIGKLLERKSHETVLEINLTAIEHNLNYFRSLLKPTTKVMAMVKAFSYGAGNVEIANILQFNNVDYLTVAYADEGVDLRRFGIKTPIMVMNPEEQSFNSILKYKLEPEIYSFRILQALIDESKLYPAKDFEVAVHLEVDTGMHRLGFQEKDLVEALELLKKTPQLKVKSVFSHLAASDVRDMDDFSNKQIALFEKMSVLVKKELGSNILCHILNTAGVSRFKSAQFDMVRLGIGLYGISADTEVQKHLNDVSVLKTKISQIREVIQGESVGYNRNWIAKRPSKIAVIPIGYADGLNRRLGNEVGSVQINNQQAPIIGNICMDMSMVDVTDIECNEADEVIVFGNSNKVENLAKSINTIPYEVFTSIPQRVKRVYYQE